MIPTKAVFPSATGLLLVLIVMLSVAPPAAEGYKSGAPESACVDLTPDHNASANATVAPFTIALSAGPYKRGSPIEVTIEGSPYFEGFFIQARTKNGSESVGLFTKFPDQTHGVACFGKKDSAATHSSEAKRNRTVLTWSADVTGSVVFRATVVKSKVIFWTNVYSQEIQISRAGVFGYQSSTILFAILPAFIGRLL